MFFLSVCLFVRSIYSSTDTAIRVRLDGTTNRPATEPSILRLTRRRCIHRRLNIYLLTLAVKRRQRVERVERKTVEQTPLA